MTLFTNLSSLPFLSFSFSVFLNWDTQAKQNLTHFFLCFYSSISLQYGYEMFEFQRRTHTTLKLTEAARLTTMSFVMANAGCQPDWEYTEMEGFS